jgi:hypothetical protein
VALSAASYTDTVGDANAAPDLTSVTVAEPVAGSLQTTVSVGNFQSLPTNSWINIWFDFNFDFDFDSRTGESGDEALVRYLSDGALELYVWNGAQLVESPTAGTTASFSAGTLTLSVLKGVLGANAAFGILAVNARGQELGDEELIASDYAPDSGRSAFVGPAFCGAVIEQASLRLWVGWTDREWTGSSGMHRTASASFSACRRTNGFHPCSRAMRAR